VKSNVPLYVGDISNLRLFDLQRAEIRSIEELDENQQITLAEYEDPAGIRTLSKTPIETLDASRYPYD